MPHIYALTKESILVSAPEALVGLDYYCPLCNAVLHVRQCVTRIPHFFLYNDVHKSSDCHDLEKVRAVIRDPTLINAQKFANSIMSQKEQIEVPGHGGHQKTSVLPVSKPAPEHPWVSSSDTSSVKTKAMKT